jgi:putative heme iron utilization protein
MIVFQARATVLALPVLSTISLDVPGYPFGSLTPYCFDENGQPIVYISLIAQHTRNIMADPRLSLTAK